MHVENGKVIGNINRTGTPTIPTIPVYEKAIGIPVFPSIDELTGVSEEKEEDKESHKDAKNTKDNRKNRRASNDASDRTTTIGNPANS